MKILRVGDPHVKVSNLDDAQKLIDFVIQTAKEREVDRVEFLGDAFDTHAIIRSEVLNFWTKNFHTLSENKISTIFLVGNHDMVLGTQNHALSPFKGFPYLAIVDKILAKGPFLYIAYSHNEQEFLDKCNGIFSKECKVLVCHQTFTGASYENNFFAKDGFDLSKVTQHTVISGHIHKSQSVGKCFYPGTPMWQNSNDANQDKGIWLFEHDHDGHVLNKEFLSTRNIVTPILKFTYKEGEDGEPDLPSNAKIHLELIGSSSWIASQKKKFKGKVSIKGIPTDKKKDRSNNNNKLLNLEDFCKNFKFSENVSSSEVFDYIRGLDVKTA